METYIYVYIRTAATAVEDQDPARPTPGTIPSALFQTSFITGKPQHLVSSFITGKPQHLVSSFITDKPQHLVSKRRSSKVLLARQLGAGESLEEGLGFRV